MGKKYVKMRRVNYDILYYLHMKNGLGFTITEMPTVSFEEGKRKTLYGPRSQLYGTTFGDEQEGIERWSCSCKRLQGLMHKGDTCPFCGDSVEDVQDNIKITGWFSLGQDKIISPLYYKLLCSALGKKVFTEIVTIRKKIDKNGNIVDIEKGSELDIERSSIYSGIGIDAFRENFFEIMEYFKKKKKQKRDMIDRLIKEVLYVFTSHIPIYSTKLRQESITEDTFYYQGIDGIINSTIPIIKLLEDASDIERPLYLQRIQQKINDMWDYNFNLINGKEGIIRGQIKGGDLNYTSRNVIIPDNSLHDDEVDLSYHTMLYLCKELILKYLMKTEDITLNDARKQWINATIRFSEKVYNIMHMILEKEQPRILLNRNPTLNYYSLLFMKIRTVTKSFSNWTMRVPIAILEGLNADFDGDILNMIMITIDELQRIFMKFSPIERMIVSRDTGLLNNYFSIKKNQLIDIYYFLITDHDASDYQPMDMGKDNKARLMPKSEYAKF